ncbi:TPA: hypothetical protein ACH3X2_010906 [Trebouxia sp. C0005]
MDPPEVLQQAGVPVMRDFDFGPALPFTMATVGSNSEFQDCGSPKASASGHMGALFDQFSCFLLSHNADTRCLWLLCFSCADVTWVGGLLCFSLCFGLWF